MKKLLLLFFILLFYNCSLYAQSDAALISELIKDIETTQVKQTGEFYAGMFPTYRECAGWPHNYQPDNNIFFTAITAFTLRNMMHRLPVDIKIRAKQIIENIKPVYRHYRNPNGNPFYSFWPANAPILPHSFYFEHLTGIFAQGDDADDSVMILMTGDNNDSDNTALKQRMQQQSNLYRRRIKSTYKKYRKIPAYCTYLGNQMHPDFDFAVQCNILYFVLDKKLPLVKQDSATIDLLARMLKNREYIKAPVYISPYYGKPAVLLYHVARLMGTFKINELQQYKDQLVADANLLLRDRKSVV